MRIVKRLLRTEFYRLFRSRGLWLILLVLFLCPAFAVWIGNYPSVEWAFLNIMRDPMPLLLASAVLAGVTVSGDCASGGFAPYCVACGYPRVSILLAGYCRYLAGVLLTAVLYPMLTVLHAMIFLPYETSPLLFWSQALPMLAMGLPLLAGVSGLFFLLAVLVPRPAAATGAAVALSLILILFTNSLYSPGDARSPLRFSPLIQYQLLARGQSLPAEYAAALGVSLLLIAACGAAALLITGRREYA